MTTALERRRGSAGATPAPPAASAARWLQRYARLLVGVDTAMLLLAGLVAVWLRFDVTMGVGGLRGVSYYLVVVIIAALWLAVLALARCYETRFLGDGNEEFRRVCNGSVYVAAAVALIAYGFKLELARGFVAIALPLGTVLLLLGRYGARLWLRRARTEGRCTHRVVVVGGLEQVRELSARLCRDPQAGLSVVGACIPGARPGGLVDIDGRTQVPIMGSLASLREALVDAQADTVAVTASHGITGEGLRRLSYELEGTGVALLVAPALTNVTGSRISIRPIAGLPLLHLDEPELSGGRRLLKAAFDWSVAATIALLLLPAMLLIAVAVRLGSRGPALFRQERVGRDGRLFRVWKFRSMYVDAEQRRAELEELNELDGLLFKIRKDPRITPVGRFLRKYSLDELPQLVNVLRGQMSLVGPRPPLPSEVAQYETHTHRRLLVKPGITGLWQVSGRNELSWEDTVRLDLQYVENWSLGLDLSILARTVGAVVRGSGY